MADEPEDPEGDDPEIQFVVDDDSRSEVYEWDSASGKGGMYIFPFGVEAWAEANGVDLVHIDKTTGKVTAQHEIGSPFRDITAPVNQGTVRPIK